MLDNIFNYLPIFDPLTTSGQPTPEQFLEIREAGYQVLINLALVNSSNAIPQEAEIVSQEGMEYIHIPVIWETPQVSDFEQFVQVLQTRKGQKIWVHCAMNMRVSAFIYLYRIIYEQVSPAEAQDSLLQIWQPNEVWQNYIDNVLNQYPLQENEL